MIDVDFDNDFGFTTVTPGTVAEETLERRQGKLMEVWDMISPLLDNLMKDPEKDIHWPDRDKKIAAFKEKLRSIVFEKP